MPLSRSLSCANSWTITLGLIVSIVAWSMSAAHAQTAAVADVVVVVDTSTSMKEPGMDPERTSLLVAKLLADIVPGDLAIVRLLDVALDAESLPSRETGKMMPCAEDPAKSCHQVDPTSDWDADARRKQLGVLVRPARGDANFKRRLDSHLEQRINNSLFHLAFRAAQGVFDSRGSGVAAPRTVVWLSDGRAEAPGSVKRVLG